MWLLNFDKTYSRGDRLSSQEVMALEQLYCKDEKGSKINLNKLSSE